MCRYQKCHAFFRMRYAGLRNAWLFLAISVLFPYCRLTVSLLFHYGFIIVSLLFPYCFPKMYFWKTHHEKIWNGMALHKVLPYNRKTTSQRFERYYIMMRMSRKLFPNEIRNKVINMASRSWFMMRTINWK